MKCRYSRNDKTYMILYNLRAHCHTNVIYICSRQSAFLKKSTFLNTDHCSHEPMLVAMLNVAWGCHIPIDIKIAFFASIIKIIESTITSDMYGWNMVRIIFFTCYFMWKLSLYGYLVHLAQIQD